MNLGFGTWSLGFRIPSRYPMSPPNLTANAPVSNVLEPLCVNFFPVRGKETDEMIAHRGECCFRFWITQEPLLAQARLDWHITAIAEADIVLVRLCFGKKMSVLQ